jgi:non-heme chloroperoxidase
VAEARRLEQLGRVDQFAIRHRGRQNFRSLIKSKGVGGVAAVPLLPGAGAEDMSYIENRAGVRLRISDRGSGDSPIVLVHGWKGSHRLWDPVIARLERSHRVVAFDLRGMGESDKPRGAYSFDEFADDLSAVIESLGLAEALLVGWSMGTTVALRYLERRPHPNGIRGLVIVNGPLRLTRTRDFPHAMSDAELGGHLARLRDGWPASEREFQAQTLLDPDPALVDWLYAVALQTPLDVALRAVEQQAQLDMRGVLAALAIPVLAVYSDHDPYYPSSLAHDVAARARRGRAIIFERSAHCIPIEEPDRLCQAIREFSAEATRS